MNINLPLSCYHFRFRVTAPLQMPYQPGVLWHSVFGKSLKEQVCISPNTECDNCIYLHECDFPQLFRGTRPPNSEIMRKYTTIPPPHVFVSDSNHKENYQTGDLLTQSLVLCGDSNLKFPEIAVAIVVAANTGLGKNRVKLQLEGIRQELPNGQELELIQDTKLIAALPPVTVTPPPCPRTAQLQLLTPYKPSGNTGSKQQLAVDRMLMAIIRRVDLMQYFTTGVKLQDDFQALKQLTENTPVLSTNISYKEDERYSARNRQSKHTSGFIGSLELDLRGSEKLWKFISFSPWLNVGKNSSMGYGNIKISPANTNKINLKLTESNDYGQVDTPN